MSEIQVNTVGQGQGKPKQAIKTQVTKYTAKGSAATK